MGETAVAKIGRATDKLARWESRLCGAPESYEASQAIIDAVREVLFWAAEQDGPVSDYMEMRRDLQKASLVGNIVFSLVEQFAPEEDPKKHYRRGD